MIGYAVRRGLASARANLVPGLFLWAVALAVVLSWYFIPPVTTLLEGLGEFKERSGFLYSIVATGLFGGLIPYVYRLVASPAGNHRETAGFLFAQGVFLVCFWSWKGFEVDLFYRLQAVMFGSGNDGMTIFLKVLVDQFVYNPVWAAFSQMIAYSWMEHRFRAKPLLEKSFTSTIFQRIITVLISTWGVWIPMVSIIYSLPGRLQIPLFNLAICFWSLMLIVLMKKDESHTPVQELPGRSG